MSSTLTEITIDLLLKRVHPTWLPILKNELLTEVIEQLLTLDKNLNSFSPNKEDIFNFAKYSLNITKAIILGRGPHYQKGRDHGLCYSTIDNEQSRELTYIYQSLARAKLINSQNNIPNALTNWARQGIVLMNMSLTTNLNQDNSHQPIWEEYINKVIELLSEYCGKIGTKKITWFLWGDDIHKKSTYINKGERKLGIPNDKRINSILTSSYPDDEIFVYDSQSSWLMIKDRYPELWWDPTGHIGYTDGSCKNNQVPMRARAGYGYHYTKGPFVNTPGGGAVKKKELYIDNVPSKDPYKKSASHKNVQKNNTQFPDKHKIIFYPSNIRSEGYAILNALKFILTKKCYMSVIIYTDSQFWIDHITIRIPRIVAKIDNDDDQWENHKNHDLMKDMWDVFQKYSKLKCPIKLEYTPAHHDCLPEFIKNKNSSNYRNYMGNKRAEEIAEMCLPSDKIKNIIDKR